MGASQAVNSRCSESRSQEMAPRPRAAWRAKWPTFFPGTWLFNAPALP